MFDLIKKGVIYLRKPACIGLDDDIMEYLKSQDVSMAQFINCLVRKYMESGAVRASIGGINNERRDPISGEIVKTMVDETDVLDQNECHERLRKVIWEKPARWLLKVHTNPSKFNKPFRQQIINMVLLDCEIQPSDADVIKIFREELIKYKTAQESTNAG